jgi:hypothetical protein
VVALPRYVRPVRKPNGRVYYYFEKFRGTAEAWRRVPLPSDPLSEDFARRLLHCGRLEIHGSGESCIFRFRDCTDRVHDLPAPTAADEFWRAVDKAEEIGKKLSADERKTFSALIVEFKNHAAYLADIGDVMRDQYDRNIAAIEEAWGDDPVAALTPVDAQKAIDAYQDTPAAGRIFRATLSRLIGWGIPRGYRNDNPILSTEKMDSDGTYEPWPPWAFELFFKKARVDLHLPVYSALFTGQRKVDVLKMLRPKPGANEMPIIAQKTKDLVPVQIHSEYRQIIAAAVEAMKPPPGSVIEIPAKTEEKVHPLHLRSDRVPWTYEGFKTAWQRQLDEDDFAKFREHRLVFHGLRKNAVNMLLEVGCSEALVSAIVGMSQAMVHHYSLKVSKFRLARSAMKLLEDGWATQRESVLGSVKRIG